MTVTSTPSDPGSSSLNKKMMMIIVKMMMIRNERALIMGTLHSKSESTNGNNAVNLLNFRFVINLYGVWL